MIGSLSSSLEDILGMDDAISAGLWTMLLGSERKLATIFKKGCQVDIEERGVVGVLNNIYSARV